MTDEARKALARLGSKLRLYARSSGHIQVIDSAAWDIVLLDLSEVERGMAELEDYKRLAEEDAVTISYPPAQEALDKLVLTLNEVREIMGVIGPAFMRPKIEGALSEAMFKRAKLSPGLDSRFITVDRRTWIECATEVRALEDLLGSAGILLLEVHGKMMEPLRERHAKLVAGRNKKAECTCSLSVRESGHDKNCPEYYFHQSGNPLKKMYIGVDRAHDEGDETCVVFNRKNDDGSATILAVLKGEAAEYVAELEESFNHLSHRFSCVLEHATGGTMSKTNYTKKTMYVEIDGRIQDLCDEAVKELKDSLPKRTLRWDGERRNGEGAYVCIYCDFQLPRLGAMIHKADCIQATRF